MKTKVQMTFPLGTKRKTKRKISKPNSLADAYPEITEIWNYEKNKRKPEQVSSKTRLKYHFRCKEGHFYTADIDCVLNNKFKCQVCKNIKLQEGTNSLADLHPDWLEEWDWIANSLIVSPYKILDNYSGVVWWRCPECEKSFPMKVNKYRDMKKRGQKACLFCKNKRREKTYFA